MKKSLRAIAKYDGPQHEPKYWAAVDADERVVVDTLNGDNRWDANEQEVIVKMIVRCVNAHEALVDALVSIEEYWNRGENNGAMSDALYHNIDTARKALTLAKEPT